MFLPAFCGFEAQLIAPECELRVGLPFPLDQAALICIDEFDVITREPPPPPRADSGRLFSLEAFVEIARRLGLPLSVAKSVVKSYHSVLLGESWTAWPAVCDMTVVKGMLLLISPLRCSLFKRCRRRLFSIGQELLPLLQASADRFFHFTRNVFGFIAEY